MKKNIFFIAQEFPSFLGGAERSIAEVLKDHKKKGYKIKIICFDENYKKGNFLIDELKGYNYGLKCRLPAFRYATLFINKKFMLNILKKHIGEIRSSEFIITQSVNAPVISFFCKKNRIQYVYYVRDEGNLNEFHNYDVGLKRKLKLIRDLIEYSFRRYYAKMNLFALRNADKIVSNSKFIRSLLIKKYNSNSELEYPKINYSKLNKNRMKKENQKYITFMGGDSAMKGFDIVLKIASKIKNKYFLVVGNYKKKFKKKNILFVPKQKDVMKIYSLSKLIIMPSRWNEAFGRIVLEANYLNIHIITSNKGGLPEVNKNTKNIIYDLEDVNEWCMKIKEILDDEA